LKQRLEEHERVQQQRELEAAQKLAEAERRRAEEQIKGRRRQRYFSYGLAVLVFVTGIIAVVAMKQRSAAQNAEKKTSEVASRENVPSLSTPKKPERILKPLPTLRRRCG